MPKRNRQPLGKTKLKRSHFSNDNAFINAILAQWPQAAITPSHVPHKIRKQFLKAQARESDRKVAEVTQLLNQHNQRPQYRYGEGGDVKNFAALYGAESGRWPGKSFFIDELNNSDFSQIEKRILSTIEIKTKTDLEDYFQATLNTPTNEGSDK